MIAILLGVSPVQWMELLLGGVGLVTIFLLTQQLRDSARLKRRMQQYISTPDDDEGGIAFLDRLGHFGKVIGASPLVGDTERAKLSAKLLQAGFKTRESLARFVGTKTALAFIVPCLTWLLFTKWFHFQSTSSVGLGVVGGALLGWRLPDFWLGNQRGKRTKLLREGLPDALDLLVVCAEGGLGLEQSLERVSRDIKMANPVIAEELQQTVDEMRVLPQIRDALDNLAARSPLPSLRSLVTTLVQSLQYGSPLGQSLRVLSAEMRMTRLLHVEEQAAKLPVLLTLPLILFILPCLFLVVAGPAAIQVLDMMHH